MTAQKRQAQKLSMQTDILACCSLGRSEGAVTEPLPKLMSRYLHGMVWFSLCLLGFGARLALSVEEEFYIFDDALTEAITDREFWNGDIGFELADQNGNTVIRNTFTHDSWRAWATRNDLPGLDLSGFNTLKFKARTPDGQRQIKSGVIDYRSSNNERFGWFEVTTEWQEFRLDVSELDMSQIKHAFYVVTDPKRRPPDTLFVDDVRFVWSQGVDLGEDRPISTANGPTVIYDNAFVNIDDIHHWNGIIGFDHIPDNGNTIIRNTFHNTAWRGWGAFHEAPGFDLSGHSTLKFTAWTPDGNRWIKCGVIDYSGSDNERFDWFEVTSSPEEFWLDVSGLDLEHIKNSFYVVTDPKKKPPDTLFVDSIQFIRTLRVDAGADKTILQSKDASENGSPPPPVRLESTVSGGCPPYAYQWTPTEGLDNPLVANPLATPDSTTTYLLTIIDAIGDIATDSVTVSTDSVDALTGSFELFVPDGISMIHIPLKVTAVGEQPMKIETIGDLYDALGPENVTFILTYQLSSDKPSGTWRNFLGDQSRGQLEDSMITDDLGIITVMKQPVRLRLVGDALGTGGTSQISLHPGANLVGVPLRDARLRRVSDLLSLEGIKNNIVAIIVWDAGQFKLVTEPGDQGDIPLTGGQSFMITAHQASVAEIRGVAWDRISGEAATAPPMMIGGHQIDGSTPILAVHGAVGNQVTGLAKAGCRVTVKNLSTDVTLSTFANNNGSDGHFSVTFVDLPQVEPGEIPTNGGRVARAGDILEIAAETSNPQIHIQPLRYIISMDDVTASLVRLPDLIVYEIPAETKLLPNYPNPFNPETWIPYQLAEDAWVTLTIYDMTGKVVRTVDIGHKPAAVYDSKHKAIYWNGRNGLNERVATGVYFYTLTASPGQGGGLPVTATRKMLILK